MRNISHSSYIGYSPMLGIELTCGSSDLYLEPTPIAYLDGRFVPLEQAQVGISTHALHYATSAFEGIRGNWNSSSGVVNVFRLREHYERLIYSAKALYITVPLGVDELCDLTVDLIRRCGYREDIYIRPVAFKGAQKIAHLRLDDLENSLAIIVVPLGDYIDSSNPIACVVSKWRKPCADTVPTGTKIAGIYTTSVLAKTEAIMSGADEALLLNTRGFVSEGSGENLFAKLDGVLTTPPREDDCLAGITRATVIQIAKSELGVETREAHISKRDLYSASEVFLTGTAAHITPVGKIDGKQIGDGKLGAFTAELQTLYHSIIRGQHKDYLDWCTPAC